MSLESLPIFVQMLVLLLTAVPAALGEAWVLMWGVDVLGTKMKPHE